MRRARASFEFARGAARKSAHLRCVSKGAARRSLQLSFLSLSPFLSSLLPTLSFYLHSRVGQRASQKRDPEGASES